MTHLATLAALGAALCVALASPALAVPAPERPRLLVYGVAHGEELDAEAIRTLIDLIGEELSRDRRFSLITENEMRRAADFAADQQVAGCEADASCVAELADAMGARFVVGGRVSRLGGEWIVSLQLLDTQGLAVLSRGSSSVPSKDRLVDAVVPATRRLLDFEHPELGGGRGAPWAWVAGGAGAVVAVAGGAAAAFGAVRLGDAAAAARDLDGETDAADAKEARERYDAAALEGNVFLIGGLAVASVAIAAGAAGFVLLGGLE